MNADRGPIWGIGTRIAPPRFLLFMLVMVGTVAWTVLLDHVHWSNALVRGFNLAAIVFTISLWPLGRDHTAAQMRLHSAQNNANRALVLLITSVVMLAILAAIATDLPSAKHGDDWAVVKLVFTLAMAWSFANLVFTLHYAHAHYGPIPNRMGHEGAPHRGGFEFPGTPEPDYWDFVHFAIVIGATSQTADIVFKTRAMRRVGTVHSVVAFGFNTAILATMINLAAGLF